MKPIAWVGVGLVVAVMLGAAIWAVPGIATSLQGHSTSSSPQPLPSATVEPMWNQGNLCGPGSTGVGPSYSNPENCQNLQSNVATPLWWNFSENEATGYTINVWVNGSNNCINLNFHSFYSSINIYLEGSYYTCLNVVLNSEGDSLYVDMEGSHYESNFYVYGTTETPISFLLDASHLTPTIYFIGTTPGFATCPSGIVSGRIMVTNAVAYGSFDTFAQTWVNGLNVAHVPVNSYSVSDFPNSGSPSSSQIEYRVTNTVPAGACAYWGT